MRAQILWCENQSQPAPTVAVSSGLEWPGDRLSLPWHWVLSSGLEVIACCPGITVSSDLERVSLVAQTSKMYLSRGSQHCCWGQLIPCPARPSAVTGTQPLLGIRV